MQLSNVSSRPPGKTATRPLNIWMVTTEMSGIKKSGGLADAVSGLSEALARLGHTVTAIMPKHLGTLELFLRSRFHLNYFDDLNVPIGNLQTPASIIRGSIHDDRNGFALNSFFLDAADSTAFGSRTKLYGYQDDACRFFFYNRATHELYCKFLGDKKRHKFIPDIVHCHDWQTGFTPFFFNHFGPHSTAVRTIYNIHNLGYSCGGRNLDPAAFAQKIGVSPDSDRRLFGLEGLEFYGRVEPHKTGILFADRVVTVSPAYAEELRSGKTDPPADLYAGVLQKRGNDMSGILNGLPDNFGPAHFFDKGVIPANFSPEDISGRAINRAALQNRVGLPQDRDAMIIGWSSRLAGQKGIAVTLQALPEILQRIPRAQFVFIAEGEKHYQDELIELAKRCPGRIKREPFNENLEILMLAGADVLLMPSRYEPCGLNQMKAQKLGTVPFVREVGGLINTVYYAKTGFSFWELSPATLTEKLVDVWTAFQNKPFWNEMVGRIMQLDYAWSSRAQEYVDLFLDALNGPRRKWPF
jgi:starch synthase